MPKRRGFSGPVAWKEEPAGARDTVYKGGFYRNPRHFKFKGLDLKVLLWLV